jgi:hypothetical protein
MERPDEPGDDRLLRSTTRRHVLGMTLASDGPIDVETLAGRLATEGAPEGLDAERQAIMLHHVHLPALAAADLVDWRRDVGTVAPTARARGLAAGHGVDAPGAEGATDD